MMKTLKAFAQSLPDATEGIACEGTALEKSTFKAGGKAFLFLSAQDAMMKLGESLAEATALAAKEPEGCRVGAHGWATITFAVSSISQDQLVRWVEESYRLLAGAKRVAALDAGATKG